MNRFARLACATLLGVVLAGTAVAAEPDSLVTLKRDLQAAINGAQVGEILKVRARFQTLAAAEPKSATLQYWMALADWRAVPLLMRDQKDKAKQHCEAGIAAAARATELDPKLAEAYALKAGLEGLSLSFKDQAAAMTLGPQMENEIGRAVGIAPSNPRVRFLDGINTLHKPAFVGGGPEQALDKFGKAIELFKAEAVTDPAAPDWGRDDAYLWAGRAAMMHEDYAGARDYFNQALAANPDNGWVRNVLLPSAEKALAGKSDAKMDKADGKGKS
jgi:tetratricopeptide (TPR) repeat protein